METLGRCFSEEHFGMIMLRINGGFEELEYLAADLALYLGKTDMRKVPTHSLRKTLRGGSLCHWS